jgi:NTP pyrophosphatase (non-canonical NTP hydrolase)
MKQQPPIKCPYERRFPQMTVYILMQTDLARHAVEYPHKVFMHEEDANAKMTELNDTAKWPDSYTVQPMEVDDWDKFKTQFKNGFNLKEYQNRHDTWQKRNFGGKHGSGYRPLLGVMEEVGELAHAHLKAEQGIRNNEDHAANKIDAVADIIIYLSDYCTGQGIDLEQALKETWDKVLKRDWKVNPDTAHEQGG